MNQRWLTLPRGSGPALRVLVISINVKRRRTVMLRLLDQGWPECAVRVLFALTPNAFAKLRPKLTLGDGFFKPSFNRPTPAVFRPSSTPPLPVLAQQLFLFTEMQSDAASG